MQVFRERCQVEGPLRLPPPKGFVRIGEVLGEVVTGMGLEQQRQLDRVRGVWGGIVGGTLARHCVPERVERRVLVVRVSHPSFKMELQGSGMLKEILARVRGRGLTEVKSIRLVVGEGGEGGRGGRGRGGWRGY